MWLLLLSRIGVLMRGASLAGGPGLLITRNVGGGAGRGKGEKLEGEIEEL